MKAKKVLLTLFALPLLLHGCSFGLGSWDPPRENDYESAYFVFVNETENELAFESYSQSNEWKFSIKPGDEVKFYAAKLSKYSTRETVFHANNFATTYLYCNDEDFRFNDNVPELTIYDRRNYEQKPCKDGKAKYIYTYRFTQEYLDSISYFK